MSTIKERICGAVDLMNDKEAEKLWMFIQRHYAIRERTWSDVEEVEPDEVDLIMLRKLLKTLTASYLSLLMGP